MANYTVTTLADETFQGGDETAETGDGAGLSLREALGLANGNSATPDTITFASGLSGQTLFLTNGQLEITTDGITVDGDINGDDTPDITISADSALGANDASSRVFLISDSAASTISAVLNGLVIRDGNPSAEGGGIFVEEGDALDLSNATVTENTALDGGGISVGEDASLTLSNVTVSSNTGIIYGGGIHGNDGSTITATGSTVSGNTVTGLLILPGQGGGISGADDTTITLTNSTVSGNYAGFRGGGIFGHYDNTITLTNSTVSGNRTATYGPEVGGGIFAHRRSDVTLTNSTVSDNHSYDGGGIAVLSSDVELTNSTVFGNSAAYFGGGLLAFVTDPSAETASLTLNNTTVSGNSAGVTGGGVGAEGSGPVIATVTLNNSILFGNDTRTHLGDEIGFGASANQVDNGGNIIGDTLLVNGVPQAGVIALTDVFASVALVDPDGTGTLRDVTPFQAGVLADNGGPVQTIALNPSAFNPAIDTGTGTLPADAQDIDGDTNTGEPLPLDAHGETRVVGAAADLGALEVQGPILVVTTLDDELDAADTDLSTADLNDLSLREALAIANGDPDAHAITFDAALTGGSTAGVDDGVITLGGTELVLSSNVTIDGDVNGDGDADITVSGNDASRVFRVDDGGFSTSIAATLNGLVIRDGAGDRGGGIRVGADEILTISNSTVSDNAASIEGGGMYQATRAQLTLIGTTVSGNTSAGDGGGIFAEIGTNGAVTLINSTISGNTAGADGGGIYADNNIPVTLTNTTVFGNAAGDSGGGIYARLNNLFTVTNSTVTGNSAGTSGGGIYSDGSSGLTTLTNSIVAGNSAALADDLFGSSFATFANLEFKGANIIGSAPVNFGTVMGQAAHATVIDGADPAALETVFAEVALIDPDGAGGNPAFSAGVLADNGGQVATVALNRDAANPAIDAGDATQLNEATVGLDLNGDGDQTDTITTDARGFDRTVDFGGSIDELDLGAFEAQLAASFEVTTLDDELDSNDPNATLADFGGANDLSLREALVLASQDPTTADTITFDDALTGGNTAGVDDGFIELGGTELLISTDVTINGDVDGDGDADITVSGDDASRVFNVDGAGTIEATLNGLVIRDGFVTTGSDGAGIRVAGGDALIITNSTITENVATGTASGGGILNNGTTSLVNTTVSDNQSASLSGGGIFNGIGGTLDITDSTLSGNQAGYNGGAIFNSHLSSVTLTNTTVSGNAADNGGGIFNNIGSVTLTNTTVAGNEADFGGGIFNRSGVDPATLTLTNATVSGNLANVDGGAIWNDSNGTTTLANTIVAGNDALGVGDEIDNNGTVTLSGGNIVGDTRTTDGVMQQTGIALTDIFAFVSNNADTGVLSGELTDNGGPVDTIALNRDAANPAIDSGSPNALDETQASVPDLNGDGDQTDTITTDARGLDRNVDFDGGGAAPDLGAFEAQLAASFEVTTLDDELDSNDPNATLVDFGGANDLSLREALVLVNRDPTTADTITFDDALTGGNTAGVDDGVITLALAQGELVVDGNVTIDGDVNGDDTPDITLSGAVSDSAVLHVYNGTVALNGLTIRDGFADYGAGVTVGTYCGCNTADVTISNSVIRNNDAEYGGGVYVAFGSSLRLVDSVVQENYAEFAGGGIYNAGTLTVINSTLSDNIASDAGGGIYNYDGAVAVLNSTLSGNFAGAVGGGITTGDGTLSLTNTTLHGNLALFAGGGIASADATVRVTNSTLTGNLALAGGGIATGDDDFTITNSIVAGNDAALGDADITVIIGSAPVYAGRNVLSEGTASANVTIETNLANIFAALETIDLVPGAGDEFQAGALANNGGPVQTVLILRGGVAFNTGDNAFLNETALGIDINGDGDQGDTIDTDARGLTRVVQVIVDIGAVELQNGVAQNDAFAILETGAIGGGASVLANNGSGADTGDQLVVTAVNGAGASVGTQITLASGAKLTVNSNGTFSYDPDGAFEFLPAVGSGASNITKNDTFTYTLPGGDAATVTITVTGIDNNDTLRGTAGVDSLSGGLENDTYFVENLGDAVNEIVGQGTDRVLASVSYVLTAGSSVELMSTTNSPGTGAINLTGNDLANTIYGNAGVNVLGGAGDNDVLAGLAGNDELNGGAGDDQLYGGTGQNDMAGGTGNDWYIVDSLTDVIIEAAGQGTHDRVFTALNYTLTAGAHVDIMTPTTTFTGAINLTGNELANTIYGTNNTNVLSGAAGNDVLAGLGGTDTLNGGDGDDTLNGEEGSDTVNGGNGNDKLFGEAGDDTLNGAAGDDQLYGGAGQNDLAGGTGDDTYYVTSATDTVTDAGVQGSLDRVYTSVNFALAAAAQIEFLATSNIAGTTAINLTGNAFANTIYGNNGANVLSGKAGNDVLAGRGGNDIFVFDTVPNTATNRDIVTDFNAAQDTIRLAKSAFAAIVGNPGGVLSAGQFVIGDHALDANDRIIYNDDTGLLAYDSNGNLAGGVVQIAVLTSRPTLSNTDIVLG